MLKTRQRSIRNICLLPVTIPVAYYLSCRKKHRSYRVALLQADALCHVRGPVLQRELGAVVCHRYIVRQLTVACPGGGDGRAAAAAAAGGVLTGPHRLVHRQRHGAALDGALPQTVVAWRSTLRAVIVALQVVVGIGRAQAGPILLLLLRNASPVPGQVLNLVLNLVLVLVLVLVLDLVLVLVLMVE